MLQIFIPVALFRTFYLSVTYSCPNYILEKSYTLNPPSIFSLTVTDFYKYVLSSAQNHQLYFYLLQNFLWTINYQNQPR